MSSFVGIPLFVLLLLPSLVSELMYISVQFFNSQGGISDYNNSSPLSQTIYAQEESDDEEIDENDGGDDNNENEEGDKEQSATNSIDICCAWDERLADGILTYRIIEDEDEDEENDDEDEEDKSDESDDYGINIEDNLVPSLRYAVENAVKEWNARVSNLKLVEITSISLENDDADIKVQFVEGFGGMVAGATMYSKR